MNLLTRIGGVLIAPRTTLQHLPEKTGARDGLALLGLYTLAVAVPELGQAIADYRALGSLPGLLQAALPLVPWLVAAVLFEWVLGQDRAHRAALCLVPLLLIATVAHLLGIGGPHLLGPADVATLIGVAASLVLAIAVRNAIPTTPPAPDLSQKPPRAAPWVGLLVVALVAASAAVDTVRLTRGWSTLAPVARGESLPPVSAPLIDGGTLALAGLPPQPHLLVFWTTWCGVCHTQMPMLRALFARYSDRGLRMVLVNGDQTPNQRSLVAAYRFENQLGEIPIALDTGAISRALRIRLLPHFVLVDADGRPVLTHQGGIGERTLTTAIESVLP